MEDTVKGRLIKFLEYKKLSQIKFQKSIGAANGYVHNLKSTIHPNFIHRISSIYPELNMDWILRGEGEMINNPIPQSSVVNSTNDGISIENSVTGDVVQIKGGHSETNELLRQILALKAEVYSLRGAICKARSCPTFEECIQKLEEAIVEI